MKLPKDLPTTLLYVLLIIFIWSNIIEKEEFDMNKLDDVKKLLNDKMGANEDNKEEFNMNQLNNIKTDLMKKMGTIGKDDTEEFYMKPISYMKSMIMDDFKNEPFEPYDEENFKDPWCDKQSSLID